MDAASLRMGAREWAMLLGLSTLWGGTYFLAELGLEGFAPFTLAFGRVLIAGLVLLGVVAVGRIAVPFNWKFLLSVLVLSMLNNVIPFSVNFWAQTRITASLTSILNATSPLITILIAHVLTRDERITPFKAFGALLGFGGVVSLIGPGVLDGFGLDVLAQLAVLGSCVSYCLANIWARRVTGMSLVVVATVQCLLSAVILAPFVVIFDQPWARPMPGATAWAAMLGQALFTTALAYMLFFSIVRSSGATNVSLATLLVPVITIVLSTAFLGETLDAGEIVGMALILVGLLVVDGRPIRALASLVRQPR